MEISEAKYECIAPRLPVQLDNVKLSNSRVLNPNMCAAEYGRKWLWMPARFGKWHTVYAKMNRWSKNECRLGFLDISSDDRSRIRLETVAPDITIASLSTALAPSKTGPHSVGKS